MSETRLTLAQLYLGIIEAFPLALENKPDSSWEVLLDESIKEFIREMKDDETYLSDSLCITENMISETVKQYPQIKIIEFEGEES